MTLSTRPPRRPTATIHRKKRYGQHRLRTQHYLRTYWPYLPLLLVVAGGLFINSALGRHSSHGVLGYATDVSSSSLLTDTNVQRTADKEQPLQLNTELEQAAQDKANDMATKNYWSHYTPSGQAPWTFIQAAGYQYQSAGENLAYGFSSSSAILSGWMNSPPHRANILDASYQDVGFGIANAPNYQGTGPETVVVAMYGQPATVQVAAASQPISTHNIDTSSQRVSRIQILTGGNAPWSLVIVAALAGAGLAVFIIKHGLLWRRALSRGEAFVIHHPWLDIGLVTLVMLSFILSQTAGVIR